jgi:hypothetical protein
VNTSERSTLDAWIASPTSRAFPRLVCSPRHPASRTGTERLHHPVVGDRELNYEVMHLAAETTLHDRFAPRRRRRALPTQMPIASTIGCALLAATIAVVAGGGATSLVVDARCIRRRRAAHGC